MSLYEFIDECEYETAAEYYSAATLNGSFHSASTAPMSFGGLPRSAFPGARTPATRAGTRSA
jgi:hypothetical protein